VHKPVHNFLACKVIHRLIHSLQSYPQADCVVIHSLSTGSTQVIHRPDSTPPEGATQALKYYSTYTDLQKTKIAYLF